MVTVGSKILIVAVLGDKISDSIVKITSKYIGHTGTVMKDNGHDYTYQYLIHFDDEKLQEQNIKEGRWLWSRNELILLDEDNKSFTR